MLTWQSLELEQLLGRDCGLTRCLRVALRKDVW